MSVNIGGTVYPVRDENVGQTTEGTMIALAVGEAGPRGDPGLTGPTGPSGPSGPTGPVGLSAYELWIAAGNTGTIDDFINSLKSDPGGQAATGGYYRWVQGSPSAHWDITHPLNRYVAVSVVDSAGSTVEGDITYVSTSELTIDFSAPFSGEAYLT